MLFEPIHKEPDCPVLKLLAPGPLTFRQRLIVKIIKLARKLS